MPYVSEVPGRIEIGHLETPSPLNPLGIKGAGEAGVIPGAAVLAAAIEDAEGIPITSDAHVPVRPVRAPAAHRGGQRHEDQRRRDHARTGRRSGQR